MTPPTIWALIVGINEYKSASLTNLRGCVNDGYAIEKLLCEGYGIPRSQVYLLLDAKATRQQILDTFVSFFIENDAIQPDDQILFTFSGHGSMAMRENSVAASGREEALVAYDSRTDEQGIHIHDIPDKTLQGLFHHLQKRNKNITVIFDCCHSGSGLREVLQNPAQPRMAESDPVALPFDIDHEYLSMLSADSRSAANAYNRETVTYTLLAACRSDELAFEYRSNNYSYGAFTYFLVETLQQSPADSTYEEICNRAAVNVKRIHPTQNPHCEGQRNRIVFDDQILKRDPFILAQKVNEDTVRLAAGQIVGLVPGTTLDVYSDTVLTYSDLPDEPLARVSVQTSSAIDAEARVVLDYQDLEDHMRALIREFGSDMFITRVSIDSDDLPESKDFVTRIKESEEYTTPSLLEFTADGGVIVLVIRNGKAIEVVATSDVVLFEPIELNINDKSPADMHYALQHYARYRALMDLQNRQVQSQINADLRVHLHPTNEFDENNPDASAIQLLASHTVDLAFDPDKPSTDHHFIVEVTNQSRVAVFMQVFVMNPDFGIIRLYPRHGQQDIIERGRSLFIGLPESLEEPLGIFLPDGWDISEDYIKVLATTDFVDLGWFSQQGLLAELTRGRNPATIFSDLQTHFSAASGTRFGSSSQGEYYDWGTVLLPFIVTRKQ